MLAGEAAKPAFARELDALASTRGVKPIVARVADLEPAPESNAHWPSIIFVSKIGRASCRERVSCCV